MGAGGVGGYFGAQLANSGHAVAFIARGRHLDALRSTGLVVESAVGAAQLNPVVATDDPATIAPVDVVMFCTKLWDVESAAQQVARLLAPGGAVVTFQNGVESHEILARALGAERVAAGVAHIATVIRAPGVIAHTGTMAKLRVGAFPGGPEAALREFVRAGRGAGIDIDYVADIARSLWEKFVFLAAFSGATCLARQPIGVVRTDPDLRAALAAAMRETVAVAHSRGITFDDGFVDKQLGFVDNLPPDMRSSMLHDLAAGNRLEAPWLSGAVIRMAQAGGVAAPVNATMYAAMKPYCDGAN